MMKTPSKWNVLFKFSTRCQLFFEGIKLWLLTQVEEWEGKWLYQTWNVRCRGYVHEHHI